MPEIAETKSRNASNRVAVISMGIALGCLAVMGWHIVCTVPGIMWNSARLAPSFALVRGLPIYALRDSGAHLGWFYGPVFPLWYLPAGLVENPTVGLMIAAVWNVITILFPVWLCLKTALGKCSGLIAVLTVGGTVLLLANPITQGAFYWLHVDALCVSWSLVACLSLHAAVTRAWRLGLPFAAMAVALAISTKQLAITLIPATVVWLIYERQLRLLWSWLFWLVIGVGGLSVIFLAAFGAEELFFNGWYVLSRIPWVADRSLVWTNLSELLLSCWVWGLAAVVGWYCLRSRWSMLPPHIRSLIRLLLWAAVFQFPLGIAASLKVAGYLNSVHAINYLLVAGLILAGAFWQQKNVPVRTEQWRLLGLLLLVGLVTNFHQLIKEQGAWTPSRGLESLLAQSRENPGKLYLPWHPLVTILSERRIYPFDDALVCLWRAGLEPSAETIRASVPSDVTIIYVEPSQSYMALRYFGIKTPADSSRAR